MRPSSQHLFLGTLAAAIGTTFVPCDGAGVDDFFTRHSWVRVKEKENPPPRDVLVIPQLEASAPATAGLAEKLRRHGVALEFATYPRGSAPRWKTRAWVAFDRKHLHVLIRGEKSPSYHLKAVKRASEESKIWSDDCFEIFLDPFLSRNEYHQYIVNSLGGLYDAKCIERLVLDPAAADPAHKKAVVKHDRNFRGAAQVRPAVQPDHWSATVSIPFADFGLENAPVGSIWGFNICRANWDNDELSQWKITSGGFHQPRRFGAVALGRRRQDIRAAFALPVAGYGTNLLTVRTTATEAQNARLRISLFDAQGKRLSLETQKLHIPEGEHETAALFSIPPGDHKGELRLVAELIGVSGTLGHYVKNLSLPGLLTLHLPLTQVYTSDKEIKGRLTITLGERSLERVRLRFRLSNGDKEAVAELSRARGNHLQFGIRTAGLKPGEYRLEVVAANGSDTLGRDAVALWVLEPPFGF